MGGLLSKLRAMEIEADTIPQPASIQEEVPFWHEVIHYSMTEFQEPLEWRDDSYFTAFREKLPEGLTCRDILFLDTETTGLSGSAGTLAFQVGIGYFTEEDFVVEQYLIRHYGQEAAMLKSLSTRLRRFRMLCTFNGATFDVPLLQSRYVMNRLDSDVFPDFHADVLYPARRLWKMRLKDCSLGHLENALLGIEREDDLPGALVPGVYFQYLKDGNFAPLQKILEHNQQDIVSLARLYFHLLNQIAHPEQMAHPRDLLSLARSQSKSGEGEKSLDNYRLLCDTPLRAQGWYALAVNAKRNGHYDEAIQDLEEMLQSGQNQVVALEALAKLWEHQKRDCVRAMDYTRQALLLLSEPGLRDFDPEKIQFQKDLQKRYDRLRRKLGNHKQES